jgi:hypothetical protein
VVPAMAETCDVCETTVTRLEFIMEGISRAPGKKPLQMHVGCLHLWDDERRRGSQAFAPVRP